jgi:lysozyme family protein
MASSKVAIDFVLRQEDSTLSGDVTTLKGDSGGATRFGIASTAHPELVPQGYFDATKVSSAEALVIAEQVYDKQYAAPLNVPLISDQALATAVLSLGINAGLGRAGQILQRACVALGHAIATDGKLGPATIAAVNASNADSLLGAFSTATEDFYRSLVVTNPDDGRFLNGWINRVAAWTANAASLRAQTASA